MDDSAKRVALTPAERSRESRTRRLERGEPSVAAVDRALRTVVFAKARAVETVALDDMVPAMVNLLMSDQTLTQRGCLTVIRSLIARVPSGEW
jgi:hypothetical protein